MTIDDDKIRRAQRKAFREAFNKDWAKRTEERENQRKLAYRIIDIGYAALTAHLHPKLPVDARYLAMERFCDDLQAEAAVQADDPEHRKRLAAVLAPDRALGATWAQFSFCCHLGR